MVALYFCCGLIATAGLAESTNSPAPPPPPPPPSETSVAPAPPAAAVNGDPTEIQAILGLARAAGYYKDIVDLCAKRNYGGVIAAADKIEKGVFAYGKTLTNGYQHGLILFALRGWALEQTGEIPKAYRQYQTSRAYIDESDLAANAEPRLEVWVGIGRTCNAAGRYTDAFTWFDAARIESAGTPRLAAAADRGLIRRAVEIGDYGDAISNYMDLERQLAALPRAASSPKTQTAIDPANWLTRDEVKEYAQLLFWTDKDRRGFQKLLDGIAILGIDNDLCMRDALIHAFRCNMMRADDGEIQRFFDALGNAILQARALKGDEGYLTVLITVRGLMNRVYPFLPKDDDLKLAANRIEQKRVELATCATSVYALTFEQRMERRGVVSTPRTAPRPFAVNKDRDDCEDMAMTADAYLKRGNYGEAAVWYEAAVSNSQARKIASSGYDGTTLLYAGRMGLQLSERRMGKHVEAEATIADGSHRGMVCLLYGTPNEADAACASLPAAQPQVLQYLRDSAEKEAAQGNSENAWRYLQDYKARSGDLPPRLAKLWCALCVALGHDEQAFEGALFAWTHPLPRGNGNADEMDELCTQHWQWGSDAMLDQYARAIKGVVVMSLYWPWGNSRFDTAKCQRSVTFETGELAQERAERQAVINKNWSALVSSNTAELHPAALARQAQAHLALGDTNAAFRCVIEGLRIRAGLAAPAGGLAILYSDGEEQMIKRMLDGAARPILSEYMAFLQQVGANMEKRNGALQSANMQMRILEVSNAINRMVQNEQKRNE